MARARKKPDAPQAVLDMTSMIDVVFQLLIYFVVTIQPMDVLTNLDVFRPAPDPNAKPDPNPQPRVTVGVYKDGYTFGIGESMNMVTLEMLDSQLARLARNNAGQTIMFTVSAHSQHGQLVQALDICAKNGLRSLSIVSAAN